MWPFKRAEPPKLERRSSGAGYTSAILSARESYLSGASALGELTATVQSCVSLWENALSLADVEGTDALSPAVLAVMARSLALRGESVWLMRDGELRPVADWDLATRSAKPTAYRLTVAEAGGGGPTETALAAEVLHVRIGADNVAPWYGVSPLQRARLSASWLHEIETALRDVFAEAPLGSQIVPFSEASAEELEEIGLNFAGRRGRVLMRESVQVAAGGAHAPATDWRAQGVTPDLAGVMPAEMLDAARCSILSAYGVLPALAEPNVAGPAIREAQRHLAQWTLQPVAAQIAAEAGDKLGGPVALDVLQPLQAYDAGGRARALSAILSALADSKAAGLDAAEIAGALRLVGWGDEGGG